jgi:hypothetical protein|tara:strand:+ start:378 stop:545 length:168 start_codon:yes stop_codon:yes gene_type:complete
MKYQKFIYFTLLSFLLLQAQSPAFMPGLVITKFNIDSKIEAQPLIGWAHLIILKN